MPPNEIILCYLEKDAYFQKFAEFPKTIGTDNFEALLQIRAFKAVDFFINFDLIPLITYFNTMMHSD